MTFEERSEIQARLFAALEHGDAATAGHALHALTRASPSQELDLLLELLAGDSFGTRRTPPTTASAG